MPKPRTHSRYTGLLVVDKPLGLTSMDVVRRVRHAAGFAKTGHAGTLDPLATGVVVCCVGNATKVIDRLMDTTKVYDTVIDLSAFTATDDREGDRDEVDVPMPPAREQIEQILPEFLGEIDQMPPAYSAIHVGGKRAYERARSGERVELGARRVRIDALDLRRYDWPELELTVTCGKGVYIRSIARELGQRLGTGGHLRSLRRTAVGRFTLAQAVTIERLEQPIDQSDLLPLPGEP
ncbi:MAG: tRNA pseudouridine(55) synthase TruB [Phycisphaeraceae bacterium]